MSLTLKKVARLSKPGRFGDGAGLYLQVSRSGTKSWLFRFERDGKERMMGLGSTNTLSLPEARERARQARLLLLDGHDPLDVKARQRATMTAEAAKLMSFEEAARAWHAAKEGGWRNSKHAAQVLSTLETFAFPHFGALPVGAVETPHVLDALKLIWSKTPETASRLRGRIESVLNYATAAGYRSAERPNPARWRGHLDHLLAAPKKLASNGNGERHHPSLPYADLPAFWQELSARPGTAARALQFTILCAARTGETIGAKISEIDLNARLWSVPAERMKAGKAHEIPLSEGAIELLQSLPVEKGNPFVFIGPRHDGLGAAAMSSVLKRMQRTDLSVHGFRSSFRVWCAERTSFPREVCEMALAHTGWSSQVEQAYMRTTMLAKRAMLMEAWSAFCSSPKAADTGKVADLAEARLRAHGAA